MTEYNPDKWEIIRFKKGDNVWYKVLGSWSGGYLDGDSWRLSSGIEDIGEAGEFYLITNHSGSIYRCHKKMKGMHLTSAGIYETLKKQAKENDVIINLISVEDFNEEKRSASKN